MPDDLEEARRAPRLALRDHRGMPDDLDEAFDRLYSLPTGQFTAARDALARELRTSGRRQEADAVRARRRPTAPAAAVNQLARAARDRVDALLDAARRLRDVQERLLVGRADRDELRSAADAERRALAALLAAAGELPEALSPAALDKVRETLQAAATDDALRDAIARGRLEREAQPSGAWGGITLEDDAADAQPSGISAREEDVAHARRSAASAHGFDAAAEQRSRNARRAAKRAAELERARAAADDARRGLEEAERAAAAAHERLEAAAQQAEEARTALSHAEEAQAAARADAQRTLRALKRAEALAAETADRVAQLEPRAE